MDDPSKSRAERVSRPVCRDCGATIDPKTSDVRMLCSACSGRIPDATTTQAAVSTIDPGQSGALAYDRAKAALAELVARGPVPEIGGEIHAAGKTLISLVALIPIVGPYLIRRSVVHTSAEKRRLARISVALTIFAVAWLIVQLPRPTEFDPRLRTRLDSEMNALGALAEQYRLEHGDFPDVATWRRLADSGDPRFYDPWGKAYRYERTVDGVTIRTLGRDGVDGGMGVDADLSAHFSPAGR